MRAFFISAFLIIEGGFLFGQETKDSLYSGNPVFPGWYADPEAEVFGKQYWIYPTYSAPFDKQVFSMHFHHGTLYTGPSIHASWIRQR